MIDRAALIGIHVKRKSACLELALVLREELDEQSIRKRTDTDLHRDGCKMHDGNVLEQQKDSEVTILEKNEKKECVMFTGTFLCFVFFF